MSDHNSQANWRARNDPSTTPDFFLKIGWDGQQLFFCNYTHEDQGKFFSMSGQPLPGLTHWLRADIPRTKVAFLPLVDNDVPILFWDDLGVPYLGYFKNNSTKQWFETLDGFQIDNAESWAIIPEPPAYSSNRKTTGKSFFSYWRRPKFYILLPYMLLIIIPLLLILVFLDLLGNMLVFVGNLLKKPGQYPAKNIWLPKPKSIRKWLDK